MNDLFTGNLVRLTAPRAGDAEQFAVWSNDSEYRRFQDSRPVMPESEEQTTARIDSPDRRGRFEFRLRTVADDRLVGFAALLDIEWSHRQAMLAVGIADREFWGRGYGSDAVSLVLRYAFDELNLERLSLNVWSLNPRAVRAYEKAGFVRYAVLRGDTAKDGTRSDSILMAISNDQWRTRAD